MANMPTVSIVMSVYNAERFVGDAVDSIISQTFSDYELLLLDDASTDGTYDILESYKDSRIVLIRSERNLGIAEQANRGLSLARGKYLARMDADDIAHPERLSIQVQFMNSHDKIGICGSFARRFKEGGESHVWVFPTKHQDIQTALLFRGAFCNPTTMMRLDVLRRHGISYNREFPPCEDYHLWYRVLQLTEGANIPEVLLDYRLSPTQLTQAKAETKHDNLRTIRKLMLVDLGMPASDQDVTLHEQVVGELWPADEAFFSTAISWMEQLVARNDGIQIYDRHALCSGLSFHLRGRCQIVDPLVVDGVAAYRSASFTEGFPFPMSIRMRLQARKIVGWAHKASRSV